MEVEVAGRAVHSDLTSLAFPVLRLVSEARNEHGMRQQDWKRYREYCARKTHRIRSTLHLTHTEAAQTNKGIRGSARQRKRRARVTPEMQSKANKGKGNEFVRKTITLDSVQDARPLELLLFMAEHAWASAEEIWAQQDSGEAALSVLRRRSLTRGRRAVHIVEQLKTLTDALGDVLDVSARAQWAAYVGLVRSAMMFIKGDWESTQTTCAVTRQLLTTIAECAPTSRDEALASSFLDALDAQIRFAAYSLGDTEQDTAVVAERVATPETCETVIPGYAALTEALRAEHGDRGAAKEPLELHWRSYTIPVHSFELYDPVTRVNEEEKQLQSYLNTTQETPVRNTSAPRAARARLSHAQRNAKRRGRAAGDVSRQESAQRAIHGELDSFDRVLGALGDAEEAARLLVEENAQALQKSHSARYEAAGLDLRRAHEWLMYRLLSVRVERSMRLVEEVQAKAAKREDKAHALLHARQYPKAAATTPVAPRASTKRPGPGSRAKRPRTTPKRVVRKPGRSGTRARAQRQRATRAKRAQAVAEAKSERRAIRIVPGIAKLLESIDSALLAIGGLEMVEGEPDVSSLMEAKRFYYSAVLLAHLGRAFYLHGLYAEALLLVQRGELYLRQASQSLELAEGAEDEDAAFAPQLLTDSDAVRVQAERLAVLRADATAAVRASRGGASSVSWSESKSGQTLYHHAQRHVSFDPENLRLVLEQVRTEEVPMEQENGAADDAAAARATTEAVSTPAPAAEASSAPAKAPEVPFGAYDPGNELLEEEEAAEASVAGQQTRGSWLSGWFRRS